MTEKQIIGHCPKCGCPIYQDIYWAGSGYPPAEYICKCDPTISNDNPPLSSDTTYNPNVQWSYT